MPLSSVVNIHYIATLVALMWFLWHYHKDSFVQFILVLAFAGTISYWIPILTPQRLRIVNVLWVSYLVYKTNALNLLRGKMQSLLWAFIIFSVYFIWDSLYMNHDSFLMTFSQYSMYFVPFMAMIICGSYYRKNPSFMFYLNKFFGELIFVQIIVSVLTLIMLRGHFEEGIVGTFGEPKGGNAGTTFPIVSLAWVLLNSNMELKGWKSWLFVVGLLLIGIAAGKRAVIILFPAFFVLFAMYVAKRRYKIGVIITLALTPLLLYLGLRLTPTLNPEHKVWGRFDPEYALNYAEDYSFGRENQQGDRGEGNGRVGATVMIAQRIFDAESYTSKTWFGNGLKRIYAAEQAKYYDRKYNFGINHRGSMTGFVKMFLALGTIGVLLFLVYYSLYLINIPKYPRLRISLYALAMFDFIFYGATTIHQTIIPVLLIFVMYFSQIQYTPSGKFVGQKHKYFQ